MISLELAKKLKDAGLVWEPKEGDWCYRRYNEQWKPRLITDGIENRYKSDIFAPSLSQLLAEIEGLGWVWSMHYIDGGNIYSISIHKVGLSPYQQKRLSHYFEEHSAEDAAAMALLWILEREKDG